LAKKNAKNKIPKWNLIICMNIKKEEKSEHFVDLMGSAGILELPFIIEHMGTEFELAAKVLHPES